MSHLRFLPADGSLVPITASTEVLLLGSQHMLECAHIRTEQKCQSERLNVDLKHYNGCIIDNAMF